MNLIKEVSTAMILRQLSSSPDGGLQTQQGAPDPGMDTFCNESTRSCQPVR